MKVALETPSGAHLRDFLAAARRSKKLHGRYVNPPLDAEQYAAYLERLTGPRYLGFFVVTPTRELVGVVNASEIVLGAFKSAYLGYYGFEPHQGQGAMTAGLRRVVGGLFRNHKLHRLEANIQPDNEASIRLVKRLGFRLEGYSPRYLKIAGRWQDHERWAITSEEWR